MKTLSGIVLLVLSLGLGAGLLHQLKQQVPTLPDGQQSAIIGQLEHIKLLDSEWSLAAQVTYSHPNANFDRLASYLPEVHQLKDELRHGPLLAEESPSQLRNKTQQLILQLEAKENQIERFKSDFAIVRNALNFLPVATQQLQEALAQQPTSPQGERIKALYQDIERFLIYPEESLRSRLLVEIGQIVPNEAELPPTLKDPLNNFLAHARVLVERKSTLENNLTQLQSAPLKRTAEDLQGLYLEHYQGQLQNNLETGYQQIFILAALSCGLTLTAMLAGGLLWRTEYRFAQSPTMGSDEQNSPQSQAATSTHPQVEQQLNDHLESMGRMAATLAHEINTPLGYINGNLQVLLSSGEALQQQAQNLVKLHHQMTKQSTTTEQNQYLAQLQQIIQGLYESALLEELPEIHKDIQSGIQQIQHVISELKDFTRQGRASRDWFQLEDCLHTTLKMTQHNIPEHIRVATDLETLPALYGSPAEINQVLINLVTNAAQAIEEAGRERGLIKIQARREGKRIRVNILDNGAGISSDICKRLFEPFFTTKTVGKGSGLGLAICQRIINAHGGHLAVKSVLGKGSSFQFTLPLESSDQLLSATITH